jgi:hypothetical protein
VLRERREAAGCANSGHFNWSHKEAQTHLLLVRELFHQVPSLEGIMSYPALPLEKGEAFG